MVMKQLACIGGLYERMTICKCDMGDDSFCRYTRDNNVTLPGSSQHDREVCFSQPVFATRILNDENAAQICSSQRISSETTVLPGAIDNTLRTSR